ncbi:hypothetical protein [Marinobacter sediminicola]|uniref:hypothetical protein n=1 Tax=Marinobacter sediminicola TaxID=3072994 RepID=UPI0028120A9C|nr:hypothetical protein [Marinobacter sp. F26243]
MSNSIKLEHSQALATPFSQLRTLLVAGVAALGLAACGGGGDGDDGGGGGGNPNYGGPSTTDNIPTTTNLAELYGLTTDANQEHRLFYIDASDHSGQTGPNQPAGAWLMAYDPALKTNHTIDPKLAGVGSVNSAVSPLALHQATIDTNTGEVEHYQVTGVTYVQEEEYQYLPGFPMPSALMRVGVSVGSMPEQVTNESGQSADLGFAVAHQIVSFNLDDANRTQYVFPAKNSSMSSRQYRLTSLDADSSTPVQDFGAGFNVQAPLFETQGAKAGSAYGWIVADLNQNDCLAFVSGTNLMNATCIPNNDGTGPVIFSQDDSDNTFNYIAGVYHLNNGAVLALPEVNQNSSSLEVTTTLWFYEHSSGKLHLLKNANGDNLVTTALPMFGPNEAGRTVSKGGETLYLAASDGGIGSLLGGGGAPNPSDIEAHASLIKITTTAGNVGWEAVYHEGGKLMEDKEANLGDFLVDAGTHFIWEINERLIAISLDGQSEVLLDGRSNNGGNLLNGAFSTPVSVVSQQEWFFYNREANSSVYATAIKTDGSKRVELKDCTWIGASTSGKANYTGGNFSSLEPSEVFMACSRKLIAAVDANNPEAGRVILGRLSETAESISMGRSAPGPHRLIQVTYEDDNDDRYEVIYVNTRENNSLTHIMDNPTSESSAGGLGWMTAPVDGF